MTPRVLIADDERDVARIVAYGVHMMWPDAEVETAADGQAVVEVHDEARVAFTRL